MLKRAKRRLIYCSVNIFLTRRTKGMEVLFIMLFKAVLTFESVDEILKCDHSNESYWAVLSCGTIYHTIPGDSNFRVCGWNPSVTIQMKASE